MEFKAAISQIFSKPELIKKMFSVMSPLCDGRMAGMSAVLFLPSFLSNLAQPHKEIKSRVYWKGYLET